MTLWVFGALLSWFMNMNGYLIGSLWGRIIEASEPVGLILVYLAGFIAFIGILRAKRVAIPAFCLAIVLIPLGFTGILLRFSRSFSSYDAGAKAHDDRWHQYAVTYRPIFQDRFDLYVAGISGSQNESDDAIRKLSASVKRPQDRGVVFFRDSKGKWIYPVNDQKVRARNIKVFPLTEEYLNWITFDATDSFEVAQKEWRSSNALLKAMPILRKGAEAELAHAANAHIDSALTTIKELTFAGTVPFLYSFLLSFLLYVIITKLSQLLRRTRPAL
jgi:hypothetical protein